jgi:hypothetical protein
MGKKYVVLGGGGSFGIHTSLFLLEKANTNKVAIFYIIMLSYIKH